MADIKVMVQNIIDTLKVDPDLATPGKIAKYLFGEPKNNPFKYPVIYVQFSRRTPAGPADSSRFLYDFEFEVGVFTKSMDEDTAEKDAYDKIQKIETILRANPDLSGEAIDSELLPWDIESDRAVIDDYAITKMVIRPVYVQWENA